MGRLNQDLVVDQDNNGSRPGFDNRQGSFGSGFGNRPPPPPTHHHHHLHHAMILQMLWTVWRPSTGTEKKMSKNKIN